MSDLAKIPQLGNAAKKAYYDEKRCFEIYGGKHSCEAPLGRVPKKAKFLVGDIQSCVVEPHRMRRKRRLFM